jgi:hypothetical protein
VASLLLAHFRGRQFSFANPLSHPVASGRARFSCITFGEPPVFQSKEVTDAIASLTEYLGSHLAFVTEGDSIPRLDNRYFKSLLKLMREDDPEASEDGWVVEFSLCNRDLHVFGELIIL